MVGDTRHVATGILNADYGWQLCQTGDGFRLDIRHRARRHIVEQYRQIVLFRHMFEMRVNALLIWPVVIRRNHKPSGSAAFLRKVEVQDSVVCVV